MGVMTKSMLWTSVFLLGSAVAIAGCGGDDDDSGDAGGVGTGGIGAGTGGVGTGTGGTTGTGGMTGGTGGMTSTSMPVPCGANMCSAPSLGGGIPGLMLAQPCCVDQTAGTCGTMSGGTCMPPPTPDPDCPMVTVFTSTMPACCAANNLCGVDASMLGMGCIDFDMVRNGPGGMLITPPPATTCDGVPVGDEDGGAPTDNDAGQ
jgi:hypothetical protein